MPRTRRPRKGQAGEHTEAALEPTSTPQSHLEEDGTLLVVSLGEQHGNVLARSSVEQLRKAIQAAQAAPVRAVLLEAGGPHFSFGASVTDHLPERIGPFLRQFHALIRELVELPVPLLAAVEGACLGGGLELILAAHRIFAEPAASFGQPEIKLGVFAPVASLLLPWRVGPSAAEAMLFSGEPLAAEVGRRQGLIDEVCDAPCSRAREYFRQVLGTGSRIALLHSHRAARRPLRRLLDEHLQAVEDQYLQDLMQSHDAVEGVQAFLQKRPPRFVEESEPGSSRPSCPDP